MGCAIISRRRGGISSGMVMRCDPVALCVPPTSTLVPSCVNLTVKSPTSCSDTVSSLGWITFLPLTVTFPVPLDDTHRVVAKAHCYACSDAQVRPLRGDAAKDLRVKPGKLDHRPDTMCHEVAVLSLPSLAVRIARASAGHNLRCRRRRRRRDL